MRRDLAAQRECLKLLDAKITSYRSRLAAAELAQLDPLAAQVTGARY